jgi:hypothetical protein
MFEISSGLAITISVFAAIVIALLGYILHSLNTGISGVRGEINRLESKFETRMGAFETRMGAFDTRMGAFETRMGAFDTRMGAFETRMGAFETRMGVFETRMGALETKLDSKLESLSARVNEIAQDVFQLKFVVFGFVPKTAEWRYAPPAAVAGGELPGRVDPGAGRTEPIPE